MRVQIFLHFRLYENEGDLIIPNGSRTKALGTTVTTWSRSHTRIRGGDYEHSSYTMPATLLVATGAVTGSRTGTGAKVAWTGAAVVAKGATPASAALG